MPKLRSHPVPALLSLGLGLGAPQGPSLPLVSRLAPLAQQTGQEVELRLSEAWRDGGPRSSVLVAKAEREPLELVVLVGEERTVRELGDTLSVQELQIELVDRPLAHEGHERGGGPGGSAPAARERCFTRLERIRASRAGEAELAPPRSERSPLAGRCLRLARGTSGWELAPGQEPLDESLDAELVAALLAPEGLLPPAPPAPGASWTLTLADLRVLLLPPTSALGLAAPAAEADRALADAFEASLQASLQARYLRSEEREGVRLAQVELAGELTAKAEVEAPAGVRRRLSEESALSGVLEWDLAGGRPVQLVLRREGRLSFVEDLGSQSTPVRRETAIAIREERRLNWR